MEQNRHFNRIDTSTIDTYLGATWNLGDHELKFGADYQSNDIFNAFVNEANISASGVPLAISLP